MPQAQFPIHIRLGGGGGGWGVSLRDNSGCCGYSCRPSHRSEKGVLRMADRARLLTAALLAWESVTVAVALLSAEYHAQNTTSTLQGCCCDVEVVGD